VNRNRIQSLLFLALVAAAGQPALLNAQQSTAMLLHPTTGTPPSFDVATIKPNNDAGPGFRLQLSPTGLKATHASLRNLIAFAWSMKSDTQLIGAPAWSNSEFFDVQAKASEADIQSAKPLPMDAQMNNLRLKVQSLITDRFQLKAHFESRELPVYALVVAKGGLKMKEVQPDPPPPPGTRPSPGAHLPQLRPTGTNQITATAWPMSEMTNWLSRLDEVGGRVVVDETGLTGHYDWVLDQIELRPAAAGTPEEPTVSIFQALPDQLGLKLEPSKAPLEVLVIDHVEEPSPN
jgi:uncharacterized protein (TIGR03435 family)